MVGTGTGETVVSTPLGGISTGVPHHIACTRSATEQVLWVDGVRVGSVAHGPFPHPAGGTWLALGGDFRTPAEAYTFRGTIDEVRISNVARYTGAGPFVPARRHTVDASTLALWHFDEGVGTVLRSTTCISDWGGSLYAFDVKTAQVSQVNASVKSPVVSRTMIRDEASGIRSAYAG